MFFFAIYWSKSVFESHLSMVTNIIFNAKKSNCGPMVYKLYKTKIYHFATYLFFFLLLPLDYEMVKLQLNKTLLKFRTLIQESNRNTYQVNLLLSSYSKEAI